MSSLPNKPAFGAPCNGCGYCCKLEPCDLAERLLHCFEGPCVALEEEDGRTWCGLVRRPVYYLLQAQPATPEVEGHASAALAYMLRLGAGCDADDPER